MTIFETPQLPRSFAEAPPSTMADMFDAELRQSWYVDNNGARNVSRFEAFDDYLKRIKEATGADVENPMIGHGYQKEWLAKRARGEVGPVFDRYQIYRERIETLREQFPDHGELFDQALQPLEDARQKARDTDRDNRQTSARYRGLPGTGTIAQFAGGMVGAMSDPLNVASMMIGAKGTAGVGAKALIWMGLKQAAVNAGVEAAFQPLVADWRKEAGLQYDLSTFAMNVAAAGALGFAADAGVRSALRGGHRLAGHVPVLDDTGGIQRWRTRQAEALELAAQNSKNAILRAAAAGDTAALREIAEETGAINNPEVRSALEREANLDAVNLHRPPDVDEAEHDAALLQAMRRQADPHEPDPVPPEPVHRTAEGEVETPEVLDARRRLTEEPLDAVEAATLIRQQPTAVNQTVSLASKQMRDARQLARLSAPAFQRIADGDVAPELGVLVGSLVSDPLQHARILDEVAFLRPESADEARRMIKDFTAPPRDESLPVMRGGLDDPAGPDGKAQADALRERYADEIEEVRRTDRAARLDDEEPELSLVQNLEFSDRLARLAELMEACKP